MTLVQLCYVSRAISHVDRVELLSIVSEASAANALRNVTGSLLFCEGLFFQVLEGDEGVVRALYEKIAMDVRHTDVQMVSCLQADERLFPNWGMACLHEQSLSRAERGHLRARTARLMASSSASANDHSTRELMGELRQAINREMAA